MRDRGVPQNAEGKSLGAIVVPYHQGIECGDVPAGERGHGFRVGHARTTHEGDETFIRAQQSATLRCVLACAISCATRGLAGVPVLVEVDVSNGLPGVTIVGLTDRAIQEARERVKPAIRNAGFSFPQRRVTVNLAPAEVQKEGTGFDLAKVAVFHPSPRSTAHASHD